MKRLLAIILAIICVLCLIACGGNDLSSDDESNIPPGLILDEETKPTEPVVETETTEVSNKKPEFVYVMAPCFVQENLNDTTLWFVVEFKEAGYRASPTDGFTIVNSVTGEVLSDVEIYTGYVCYTDDHDSDDFVESDIDNDNMQYVIGVTSDDISEFEDVCVSCDLIYGYINEGSVDLMFNLGMENIITDINRLHGNAVYRQDDIYYIKDTDIVLDKSAVVQPEFVYSMAPVYKEYTEENVTTLWFAAEFKTLGYYADMFEIKLDGQILPDVQVYKGNVCSESHIDDFINDTGLDYKQYTICVTAFGNVDFDDLQVLCNLGYGSDYESTELEFNAGLDDITTQQEYIHGNTLFGLDGKYYIHDDRTGMYSDDGCAGESYEFICINGDLHDLVESLQDNVVFVYGPVYDVSEYDGTGYGSDSGYLDIIDTPYGCEMYVGYNLDVVVGYKTVDDYILLTSDLTRTFVINMQYQFDNGQTMTLIAF